MRNQSQKRLGIIALLLTAILWSLSGVFIKYIPWNPVAIAGVRSFFALFLLVPLTRRENWHFSKDQWLVAISYVGMMVGFVVATKWTTAANAILLQYTSPVYIILLSTVFLGEKITWRDWLTMAVTGIGMGAFFLDKLGGGSVAGTGRASVASRAMAMVRAGESSVTAPASAITTPPRHTGWPLTRRAPRRTAMPAKPPRSMLRAGP